MLSVLICIMTAADANSNLRSSNGSGIDTKENLLENIRSANTEHGKFYHHTSRRNTKSKKSIKSKKAKGSKSPKKSKVANTADTNNPISSRTSKIKIEQEEQIETAAPTFFPSTSASPSSMPSSSPTLVFDLGNCETYDYYWYVRANRVKDLCFFITSPYHVFNPSKQFRKKDLYHTCGSDWSTCECKGASWRIEKGDIDCATAACPKHCDVCYFCLMEVNNCVSF